MNSSMQAPAAHLRFEPELTIYHVGAVRERLCATLAGAADGATLRLDLVDVCDIDSAGMQLLLALREAARERGVSVAIEGHGAAVLDAFALFGLDLQLEHLPPPRSATSGDAGPAEETAPAALDDPADPVEAPADAAIEAAHEGEQP